MDESTAIGSCSDDDGERDNVAVLGKTLVATVTDETAVDILRESEAYDVVDETAADTDETEVLVTSGTAQSKYITTTSAYITMHSLKVCTVHVNYKSISLAVMPFTYPFKTEIAEVAETKAPKLTLSFKQCGK